MLVTIQACDVDDRVLRERHQQNCHHHKVSHIKLSPTSGMSHPLKLESRQFSFLLTRISMKVAQLQDEIASQGKKRILNFLKSLKSYVQEWLD